MKNDDFLWDFFSEVTTGWDAFWKPLSTLKTAKRLWFLLFFGVCHVSWGWDMGRILILLSYGELCWIM